jgi:hypothetical protein
MGKMKDLTCANDIDYSNTHTIGIVDDCYRCIRCEVAVWNAWKKECAA